MDRLRVVNDNLLEERTNQWLAMHSSKSVVRIDVGLYESRCGVDTSLGASGLLIGGREGSQSLWFS